MKLRIKPSIKKKREIIRTEVFYADGGKKDINLFYIYLDN